MKKWLIIGAAFISLIGFINIQYKQIKKIKLDRDVYKTNTTALLNDVEHYKTKDSLNAVSLTVLEFKLDELSKYRAEDMQLIETLQADKKRLQQITTAQTQTIYELNATVRDSIIYRDNYIIDTLTHIADHQVGNRYKPKESNFWNSDLCTTNFRFV